MLRKTRVIEYLKEKPCKLLYKHNSCVCYALTFHPGCSAGIQSVSQPAAVATRPHLGLVLVYIHVHTLLHHAPGAVCMTQSYASLWLRPTSILVSPILALCDRRHAHRRPASFRQPNVDRSFSHSSQPNCLSSSVLSSPLSLSITPTLFTLNSKDTFSLNPSRQSAIDPTPSIGLPLRTPDCSMVFFLVFFH